MVLTKEEFRPRHSQRGVVKVAAVVGVDLEAGPVGAGHIHPDSVAGVENHGRRPKIDLDEGRYTSVASKVPSGAGT